jgi:tetratricopeptide (TPR) repeat protein
MPDEALELLQRRLARYECGETGAVTGTGALAEAMAAMAGAFVFRDASGDLEFDLEILDAVAFLRLYWHQAAPSQDAGSEEDGLGELYEALRVFALLLRCDPDRVPDALTAMAQAVADDQGTDPLRLTVELGRLALDYHAFYAASRMLDTAVASGAVPEDRPALLSMLGRALRGLYTQVPNRVTADQMVDAFRGAVAALDAGDDRHAGMLSNLSVALTERFDTYRDPGDAQQATAAAQEAIDRTPAADRDRAARLANLGNALAARYERGGHPHDRQQAIETHRHAARQAGDADPDRAGMLANLARALLLAPVPGTGDAVQSRADDITEAVTAARATAEATDPASPAMPGRLAVLGTALAERSELSGGHPRPARCRGGVADRSSPRGRRPRRRYHPRRCPHHAVYPHRAAQHRRRGGTRAVRPR